MQKSPPSHQGHGFGRDDQHTRSLQASRQLSLPGAFRNGPALEPTAAALAYGLDVPSDTVPKNIVVFDFGASTLEVTVLRADRGLFETLATTSDPSLVRVVFVGG